MNEARHDAQQTHGPNGHDHDSTADSLVQAMGAIERIGGRLSTGATGLADSVISSIGALSRRVLVQLGETVRTAIDQAADTAQQIVQQSQETLERTLDAAGTVAEDGVRFVERSALRLIEAAAEISGAMLERVSQPGAVRTRPTLSPIVQAAS